MSFLNTNRKPNQYRPADNQLTTEKKKQSNYKSASKEQKAK